MGRPQESDAGATVREIVINGRRISDSDPCYVIAEIGHNHGGNVKTATKMIQAAAACGASAAKLQKRDIQSLYTKALLNQPYEHEHSFGKTYGLHREALEFGLKEYLACRAVAKASKIDFFATAFDERSADFLMEVDVPAFKIASGDLTNVHLLRYVASLHQPIILSTGGGTMADIDRAVSAIYPINPQLAVLHCTAAYPVQDYAELNLRCIGTLREAYPEFVIGWSGHDSGIAMPLLAYSLGARIIEKHFTLNRANKGTDHAFSLEPVGLRKLVRDLERAGEALGDGVKRRYSSEEGPLRKMAKSLIARQDLPAGTVVEIDHLVRKSPASGLAPYEAPDIVGRRLLHPVAVDEPITWEHFSLPQQSEQAS